MAENKLSKTWTLTLNNYTDEDEATLRRWDNEEFVSRFIVTKEIGDSGTPHYQGAVTFKVGKRMSALKKLHPRVHWEIAKCSDAGLYCLKHGSESFINSDHRTPGTAKDFQKCVGLLRERGGLKRVREEYPEQYVRHVRKFKECYTDYQECEDIEREVYWFHGASGTGKSRTAREEAGKDVWVSSNDLKWFDGYVGQDAVIFDDLPRDTDFIWLLRLTDRYGMQVPIKGGFTNWRPKKVFITSILSPEGFFSKWNQSENDGVAQLLRRIKEVRCFN